jgi:type IX secretion system PorP/SprF family membrane protein
VVVVTKKNVLLSRFSYEPNNLLLTLPISGYLNPFRIKFYFILLLITFQGIIVVYAQQPTLLTHYMFTNMAINPAFAGNNGGICVTGLVRQQWMGFKDPDGSQTAPQTFLITADSPIRALHGGIGGSLYQDQLGFFKNIGLNLGYAYKMDAGNGDLSFGLQVGLQNGTFDFSKFDLGQGVGNLSEDPVLRELSGKTSDMTFDIGAGILYKVPEKFYIGLSAANLLQSKAKTIAYQLRRTYYLGGGYEWIVPNHPAFEVLPSALLMYDGAAFQLNLSALVFYNNKFYGGLGYRLQDAVSVLAGVSIKSLRIGVAYDISTSALSKYNSGGLEVMVSYCFKIDTDKFRKSYRNTRFL